MKTTKQLVHDKIVELIPDLIELVAVGAPVRANKENIYRVGTIHLEHVLRAIQKNTNGDGYYVRDDGTFFKWERFTEGGSGHHGVESTYITYDLTRDHDNQSDEYYEWLKNILCV